MSEFPLFRDILSEVLGIENLALRKLIPQAGGSISKAFKAETSQGVFFIKSGSMSDMFDKEEAGLNLLRLAGALKVPEVIGVSRTQNISCIIMEYINVQRGDRNHWEEAGSGLARLHKFTTQQYGLDHDNYMGSVPQVNKAGKNWVQFFIENRLFPLAEKCRVEGLLSGEQISGFEKLYRKLGDILTDEKPALVHGDLWSGNIIFDSGGPVLIDPAVYYGHREVDLAMTRLFGRFPDPFYQKYSEVWPADSELEERMDIYNLYPLLIHLLLFGKSYLSQILLVLKRFS
jgi:protein-ribulosamine 3-kinase